MKTKEKGNVKNTIKVIANGIQILNGKDCIRFNKVPIILLDYDSPESSHPYAKGERFSFWTKLEDAEHSKIVEQLNPNLKELTFWFDEDNKQMIKEFLNTQLNQQEDIQMVKLNEEAKNYAAPTMKNITELDSVPTDAEITEEVFKEGTEDEFKVKVIRVDGEAYRVPVSVLKSLKAILEIKPDLKKIKVTKSGTGMTTEYTVIPLE